jgi:hypothetical protein
MEKDAARKLIPAEQHERVKAYFQDPFVKYVA